MNFTYNQVLSKLKKKPSLNYKDIQVRSNKKFYNETFCSARFVKYQTTHSITNYEKKASIKKKIFAFYHFLQVPTLHRNWNKVHNFKIYFKKKSIIFKKSNNSIMGKKLIFLLNSLNKKKD